MNRQVAKQLDERYINRQIAKQIYIQTAKERYFLPLLGSISHKLAKKIEIVFKIIIIIIIIEAFFRLFAIKN